MRERKRGWLASIICHLSPINYHLSTVLYLKGQEAKELSGQETVRISECNSSFNFHEAPLTL